MNVLFLHEAPGRTILTDNNKENLCVNGIRMDNATHFIVERLCQYQFGWCDIEVDKIKLSFCVLSIPLCEL